MSILHLPWLELSVLISLIGAVVVACLRGPGAARQTCLAFAILTCLCAVGASQDFEWIGASQAASGLQLIDGLLGRNFFVIDHLTSQLIPLSALLHLLTILVTSRTKVRRFSFSGALASNAIVLATLSCRDPWGIIAFLAVGTVLPYFELVSRGKPTRGYVIHMALFLGFMVGGWAMVEQAIATGHSRDTGILLVLIAMLIRCGLFPFHGWMVSLFEHATFGLSLLFVTPMLGIYGFVRLVFPMAPDGMIWDLKFLALTAAFYASGMSLVQNDIRRFYCNLFLAHSSLVLVGLCTMTSISTTGALCIWLSVSLAMGGLGLTLRAIESRRGRLFMGEFQGLYEHTPNLAMCFGLTGLAAVGFPGTFGFVGMEILMDGVVMANPLLGAAVVVVGALNGIAIVQAFFRLFTGASYSSSVSLTIRLRERYGVLALATLILIGGINPQGRVASRHEAAVQLLRTHLDRDVELTRK